jgi:L-ascorbate metabolism protein UlaG (beta-lactamase superfamily)
MIDAWAALGTKPSGERLERIEQSPQYRDGRFRNTLPRVSDGFSFETTWEFFTGGSDYRAPQAPLPVVTRTAADFAGPAPDLRATWLGHSTLLFEIERTRVLVDPVWGERASPSRFVGSPRFYAPPLALGALPSLDAVVISHDHYDHLDLPTVRALAEQVPRWIVPLGVGAHLEAWGVAPERIEELDWWEETDVRGVRLVSTPARHFSGRFLNDRDATLWTGWAFLGVERQVWYSGDTALTPEFAEIGRRLGPFDLTFVESGAYNPAWADVHLGPEQAVAAHQMVRGGLLVPIHWGLFDLALHGWTEPAERVRVAAAAAGVPVAFPRPGESLTPGDYSSEAWWPSLPWKTAAEVPVVSTSLPDSVVARIPRP